MIRYVVFGGYLRDEQGKEYFVPATEVMRAYGVNPRECIVRVPAELERDGRKLRGGMHLIQLWPQQDPAAYGRLPER